jgi:hypothetical protein
MSGVVALHEGGGGDFGGHHGGHPGGNEGGHFDAPGGGFDQWQDTGPAGPVFSDGRRGRRRRPAPVGSPTWWVRLVATLVILSFFGWVAYHVIAGSVGAGVSP